MKINLSEVIFGGDFDFIIEFPVVRIFTASISEFSFKFIALLFWIVILLTLKEFVKAAFDFKFSEIKR